MVENILRPEGWIDNYSDYLYKYAYIRVNASELAEDLVQDTFFSAYKARDSFKGKSTEKTWLVSILKRKIIDHFRKNARNKEVELPEHDYHFAREGSMKGHWEEKHAPKNWEVDVEQLFENNEFFEILNQCLSKLPDKWAAVFSLKVMEDYSTDEVCKEMDITSSNLWVLLHRARLMIRDCIEKNWFEK